jgi:hypothetical protein
VFIVDTTVFVISETMYLLSHAMSSVDDTIEFPEEPVENPLPEKEEIQEEPEKPDVIQTADEYSRQVGKDSPVEPSKEEAPRPKIIM